MSPKKKDQLKPLIPPDYARCQTEWKSGSFMTLGPREWIRCKNIPVYLAAEVKPDEHGRKGSMTLCLNHSEAIKEYEEEGSFTLELIQPKRSK